MMDATSAVPVARTDARGRTIVLTRANIAPHAGGKAPADVQAICAGLGFGCVSLPVVPDERLSLTNLKRFGGGTLALLAARMRNLVPGTVIIQHPIVGKLEKRLILWLFRASRKIALVHDLDVLRKPTDHDFDDLDFLGHCDVVIAHNEAMRQFLAERLPHTTVLVLGIFDFLVPAPSRAVPPPAPAPTRIFVIGNLHPMKASYLYKIGRTEMPIAAYGPSCAVERLPDTVTWCGTVGREGLPVDAIDGFGLVWDGESPDRLEGQWGEYLRYNAPHKLSLYVVLGLPVIVHRASAMADLVLAEGIGFVTDSIAEAAQHARSVSTEQWNAYCQAVLRLREKITGGFHTTRVLDLATSILNRSA